MTAQKFRDLIEALGQQFGQNDNQVGKWAGYAGALGEFTSQIEEGLAADFETGSAPMRIFSQGAGMHQRLAAEIEERSLPDGEREIAAGYLNLRYYIYLNGFLQACAESLEKVEYNAGLNQSALVEKSDYKPFFFDRVTVTTEEIIAMLEDDLARLRNAPQDKKGVVQAVRIRKGVVSTLTESYCPAHPWHYPPVAQLDAVKASTNPAVIGEIAGRIEAILLRLKALV